MTDLVFEPDFKRRTNRWQSQPVKSFADGKMVTYIITGAFTAGGDPLFVCYRWNGGKGLPFCISKNHLLPRLWEAIDVCEEHYKRERDRYAKQFGAGNLDKEVLDP